MAKRLNPRGIGKAFGGLICVAGFLVILLLLLWQVTTASTPGRAISDLLGRLSPNTLAFLLDHAMVTISAGPFKMGSAKGRTDELPVRQVALSEYAIDRFEVTNAQYARFLKITGRTAPRYWTNGKYPTGLANNPVVGVSWQEATEYCAWAGKRLPSEAEWEKACRGADGFIYPWGNVWRSEASNTSETCRIPGSQYIDALWPVLQNTPLPGQIGLRPVGSYPRGASPYGVMDMSGNAAEWVQDWYNAKAYSETPSENPIGFRPQWNHVLRGSSWWVNPSGNDLGSGETAAFESRCAARNASHSYDDPRTGFRCAK